MSKIVKLCAAMALALPVASGFSPASAQSFSCANAQIPSEMAICNSENLLIKDEQVAELLASQLVSATAKGSMQKVSTEHGKWLKRRNACNNDISCLDRRYDERIRSLTAREL